MKTFDELETYPEVGDLVKPVFHDIGNYDGVTSSDGLCILNEPEQSYTVVSTAYDAGSNWISANGNLTGRTFEMNDVHWRPLRDTTKIDWNTRKRVYFYQRKHDNVSLTARQFKISRRSVSRIVREIASMGFFKRMFIRMGL